MVQDNDMTDKKKKCQIKCYYLTPSSSITVGIEMVIDEPEPEPEVCEKVLLFILFTQTYLSVVSQAPVEGRDTHMRERQTDGETERGKKKKK